MDERYMIADAPTDREKAWALKPIDFGKLKNKTAIDPQWRIDKMTEIYGLCGIGWKVEIAEVKTETAPNKEELIFMTVNLFIRDGDGWSGPVVGVGGDKIIALEKGNLVPNDEAWKKCYTDAVGNAMKYLGIGAAIYRGGFQYSKYASAEEEKREAPQQSNQPIDSLRTLQNELRGKLAQAGINGRDFAGWMFNKQSCMDLSEEQLADCLNRFEKLKELYGKALEMKNAQR